LRTRKLVAKQVRKGFDSLVFLVGWRLWKERNARTFNAVSTPADRLVSAILNKAEEWCLAGFKQLLSLTFLL
jgi:predicted negative regulator of RcsB-dependent stress response